MRWSLVVVLALASCGGGVKDPPEDSGPPPVTQGADAGSPPASAAPLLPIAIGAEWRYRVTDGVTGAVSQKTTRVVAREPMDGSKAGIEAFRIESVDGLRKTIVWVEPGADYVFRHREDTLLSGKLLMKTIQDPRAIRGPVAMPTAGGAWPESYNELTYDAAGKLLKEDMHIYQWTVRSLAQSVTVPAGTFQTVELQRVRTTSGKIKRTWWMPGIGKIREDDDGTIEELTGYQLP